MEQLLPLFVIIPLCGLFIGIWITPSSESAIAWTAMTTLGLHLLLTVVFVTFWVFRQSPVLTLTSLELVMTKGHHFSLDFYFDQLTAVYLLIAAFLILLVVLYCRYYLHREPGYKRFFLTTLFFYLGYVLIVVSGNLEMLFAGWELIGLSSVLLIAFYRGRYLPVKNALKVFSMYRLADGGLLLAMWMSHQVWPETITFAGLNPYERGYAQLQTLGEPGMFISLMLLLSALVKSAQFPFSAWLPRAMEGPTPSSAIFYGSLSMHIGIFLLLRTAPLWETQLPIRLLMGGIGLLTCLIASGIARAQASIKSQLAYASIAQIGIIFLEIALGFHTLALVHVAGHAFLRTYQLLISPSIVSYLIREQAYTFTPVALAPISPFTKQLRDTWYVLSLTEWNLDTLLYRLPRELIQRLGQLLSFLSPKWVFGLGVPLYGIGLLGAYYPENVPSPLKHPLSIIFALLGLLFVVRSFSQQKNVFLSWLGLVLNPFWIALAIAYNEEFAVDQVHLYLSGIAVAGLAGYGCLHWLYSTEGSLQLSQYSGYAYPYPKLAFGFLLCCLGVAGFPITPTFLGEDLLFSHIHPDQTGLAFLATLSFMLNGLSALGLYARIFLGPWPDTPYGTANRSS
ncbi:proton-conducting transporter transmembrane domain-containing protein [Spirosoma litoris]